MFPQAKDQNLRPATWRAKLHRAANLVVAFATLDSYSLPGAPHDVSASLPHPHGLQREPLRHRPRTRGHGVPPTAAHVCVNTPGSRRPITRTAERTTHPA